MNTHVTVYSPNGEMFENVSYANARDLTTHAGWSYNPPENAVPKEEKAPTEEKPTVETLPEPENFEVSANRYSALDKPAMIELLKEEFGYEADGRMSLPKLVAKAVELEAETNA